MPGTILFPFPSQLVTSFAYGQISELLLFPFKQQRKISRGITGMKVGVVPAVFLIIII
jgi:hypothetical protein